MNRKWQVQEAKAKFSELLETTEDEGPQLVTKRGRSAAVLISYDEWKRMKQSVRPDLKELLLSSDARTDNLTPLRQRHRHRKVREEG